MPSDAQLAAKVEREMKIPRMISAADLISPEETKRRAADIYRRKQGARSQRGSGGPAVQPNLNLPLAQRQEKANQQIERAKGAPNWSKLGPERQKEYIHRVNKLYGVEPAPSKNPAPPISLNESEQPYGPGARDEQEGQFINAAYFPGQKPAPGKSAPRDLSAHGTGFQGEERLNPKGPGGQPSFELEYKPRDIRAFNDDPQPDWLYGELLEDAAGWTTETYRRYENEGNNFDDLLALMSTHIQIIPSRNSRDSVTIHIPPKLLNELRQISGMLKWRRRSRPVPKPDIVIDPSLPRVIA